MFVAPVVCGPAFVLSRPLYTSTTAVVTVGDVLDGIVTVTVELASPAIAHFHHTN